MSISVSVRMGENISILISGDSHLDETLYRGPWGFSRGNSMNFSLGLIQCNFHFFFIFNIADVMRYKVEHLYDESSYNHHSSLSSISIVKFLKNYFIVLHLGLPYPPNIEKKLFNICLFIDFFAIFFAF